MKLPGFIRILILVPILFFSCKEKVTVTGSVTGINGETIPDAIIEVNGSEGKFEGGKFTVKTPLADRYVLNVWAEGYGLGSKVYTELPKDPSILLTKATTQDFSTSGPIVLVDNVNQCYNSVKPQKWNPDPVKNIPTVYDANGRLIGFEMPESMKKAFEYYFGTPECNTGTTIEIDPGTLVDASGNPPPPSVTVSVSTIDLWSPDGMPGDYSIIGQQPGYMQSFGAGTVDVYTKGSKGKKFNLKEGATAKLIIPIDPGVLKLSKDIPKEMPFFVYDRKLGQWRREGSAVYDGEKRAYVKKVSHFSEFNMDLEKTNPACAKFWINNDVLPVSAPGDDRFFKVRLIFPDGIVPTMPELNVHENISTNVAGNCYKETLLSHRAMHAIQRIPPGKPIGLAILNASSVITSITILNVAEKGTCDDCGMDPSNLWKPACDVGAACPNVGGCDPVDNTKAYPVCSGPALLQNVGAGLLLAEADCQNCNNAAAADNKIVLSWVYAFPAGSTNQKFYLSGGVDNGSNTYNTADDVSEVDADDNKFTLDVGSIETTPTGPNLMCAGVAKGKIKVSNGVFGSFEFTCADPFEVWKFKVVATYNDGANQKVTSSPVEVTVTNNP